ncbi:MAG: sigma-54-dependent Fis family transcriptional regulator [Spirochaetales bacterium]|nr:sigma-54-dependent Fis family transcriptional regulator [Spirochaetales bacterium]
MSSNLYPTFPVLIVDDEESILISMRGVLKASGINNIICINDSREVLEIVNNREIGLILLDLTMPYISGEELLPILHRDFPEIPIIIITGNMELTTAVECMKLGAADYLVKSVEKSKLVATVKKMIEIQNLKRENRNLRKKIFSEELEHPEAFTEIITDNSKMKSLFAYMEAIAKSSQVVLITGETGVGKDLIARSIHKLSDRKDCTFLPVNIAGLDDNLFTDTLFGHRRGAFTGASQVRSGLIEKASHGTLCLDEIGDLSITSQVKLLRLLESQEYFPLGSDLARRSEARVIVATNRDLEKSMESGLFRRDLYYRLSTHHIHMPPLRERTDDLPLLIEHFIGTSARELGKKKPTPPPELFTLLGTYYFPGNIRELESMIFDAVSKHKSGVLSLETFIKTTGKKQTASVRKKDDLLVTFSGKIPTIKQVTELLIAEVMKRSKGNQTIAARHLGISPQALSNRLKKTREKEN